MPRVSPVRHPKLHNLDSHTDVSITSPSDGEVLTYDAINAVWKNLPSVGADIITTLKDMVETDGIFWFNNNWLPANMVTNGTYGSADILWDEARVTMNTGSTSGSYAWLEKDVTAVPPTASWDVSRYFRADVLFYYANTNCYIHIVSGYIASYSSDVNTYQHVGFKLINGLLYGTVANGTTESTLLLEDISGTTYAPRSLLVKFNPSIPEARFYVNGVDKGAISTNLPSGTYRAGRLLHASIYNTAAQTKILHINNVRVFQEPV